MSEGKSYDNLRLWFTEVHHPNANFPVSSIHVMHAAPNDNIIRAVAYSMARSILALEMPKEYPSVENPLGRQEALFRNNLGGFRKTVSFREGPHPPGMHVRCVCQYRGTSCGQYNFTPRPTPHLMHIDQDTARLNTS